MLKAITSQVVVNEKKHDLSMLVDNNLRSVIAISYLKVKFVSGYFWLFSFDNSPLFSEIVLAATIIRYI